MNEFLDILGDVLRIATFQEWSPRSSQREFGIYWPERLPYPSGPTRRPRHAANDV